MKKKLVVGKVTIAFNSLFVRFSESLPRPIRSEIIPSFNSLFVRFEIYENVTKRKEEELKKTFNSLFVRFVANALSLFLIFSMLFQFSLREILEKV